MGADFDADSLIGCDDDDCRFDPFCHPRLCTLDGDLDCSSDPLGSTVGAESGLVWYPCGITTEQPGPENLHTFTSQSDGEVTVILDGQSSNHDMFLLTTSCEPLSCIAGVTSPGTSAENLTFNAVAGETYYLAVEAQGGEGAYTLDFLENGGCAEDCDNGVDDDLDGATDCNDSDCALDLPCTGIFTDGFESGDPSAWSSGAG